MEKLSFSVDINATPQKVWDILWNDKSYREWTSVYTAGSYYEGSLEEGSIVKFLDPNNNGMYARIEKIVPAKELKFLHLGEIYNGVEKPQDWVDATESYFIKELENGVTLTIEVNSTGEFADFFNEKTPKALDIVKDLCEKK